MAVLSAVFRAVDQLSDVLGRMGDAGANALDRWESGAAAADEAFARAAEGADRSAQSAVEAANAAGGWTDAIGNYDKWAMEAIYTTEELVEMGFKTQEALDAERASADEAAKALDDLEEQSKDTGEAQEDMGKSGVDAMQAIASAMASAGILKGLQEFAAALLDAADAAATVETSYAKLETIAGGGAMGALTAQIKDLSAETGIAQDALSDVAYNAISAGSAVENSVGAATAASKLATAGFTQTSSALSVLTTAMNSYGDSAGTAMDISDGLIMVQNLGVTTVAELASNMGRSISTASAYNVSLSNLESAYVSVTKAGINTAEGTTYISGMLSELGKENSTVAKIIREQTGQSFGQLMESGSSLADVLSLLYDYANNDAEAMMNLWGSQTAGMASAAIVNQSLDTFNQNLQAIENSAGATESAYSVMADTTEFAYNRMTNSAENLKVAIGSSLNPALGELYRTGAAAFDWAADFLTEHPVIVRAVTAVGVGVGVVAAGIAGVTFVSQAAIPAIVAFGGALQKSMGPIGWVSLGLTAIVAAGAAMIAMFQKEETEYDTWTASTRKQYDALRDLNSEYERAVETYGETSEEALRLRYQIDDLSAEFEAAKMTVEEFTAQCEALTAAHNDLAQSYADSLSSIGNEEAGTLALIQKLGDLASSSEQTAASQMQMESIIESLNASFPDLAISIDDVTQNTGAMVSALKQAAEQQADQERYQESYSTYVGLLKEQAQLEEQIAAAEENIRLEQERMDNMSGLKHLFTAGEYEDLEAYQAALEELQAAYADNIAMQGQCEQAMQDYADAAAEAANATVSYEDAVSGAISSVTDDLDALAEKYEAAYGAALDSVQGQYALWDRAAEATATNAGTINSALESQIDYWEKYNANLTNLGSRSADIEGLNEMLASFADGSSDSVNAVAGMAAATDGELAAMVASWQALQEVQGTTADNLAQLETDFDESLAAIENRMNESIDNMNMDTEAAEAARATMDSYIAGIRAGTGEAHDAAAAVAATTANALSGPSAPKRGYATGTTYAEPGVHIVGEEGPEAILFNGGETVLNANDTRQYLSGQAPLQTSVPETDGAAQNGGGDYSERRIVLELAGHGSIELSGRSFDPDAAAEWMMDNIRPALMQALKQEMQEEGDGARDF